MEIAKIIFESYNKAVEESYSKALIDNDCKDPLKVKEADVAKYLHRNLAIWADSPIDKAGGLTPRNYFNNILNYDEVLELVKLGARVCDRDLPQLLVDKLMSYGDLAVDSLLDLASDRSLLESEEDFYISIMAIKVLGERKVSKSVNFLIDLAATLDEGKEAVVEAITDALISIGMPSIRSLMDRLESAANIGYIEEYLLTALVKIGKENKSDEIYRHIKNAFIRMDDKVLGAMCVADYGDGRAIPALKGYAEKNKHRIDKQTYLEIKAAVKRLGGTIKDMNMKFD